MPVRTRAPGPGLFESFLWTVGLLLAQLVAMLVTVVALAALFAGAVGPERLPVFFRQRPHFVEALELPFFCGVQGLLVLFAVSAVVLRLGRGAPRLLALTALPGRHVLCILFGTVPLSMLSGQLYLWVKTMWQRALPVVPVLQEFEQMQSLEFVKDMAAQASLPLLLVMIAIAPAITEELVFRGVIGRGLTARWGVPAGICLTSTLFAAAHLYPPQAVALLPLAVFIHLLYWATRSFWAPVLVHLLNNGWAAVVTKYESHFDADLFVEATPLPLDVLLTSSLCVAVMGVLAWTMRLEYHLTDGSLWNPGYPTVEKPSPEVSARAECRRPNACLVLIAMISVVAFAASLTLALMTR